MGGRLTADGGQIHLDILEYVELVDGGGELSSGHTADTVGTVDTERAARRTTGRRRKRRERETLHWLSTNQPTLVLLRFERDKSRQSTFLC